MGKRMNGEGSVYYVEGRGWRADIVVGRLPNGTLDRNRKTFELKSEAMTWLKKQLKDKEQRHRHCARQADCGEQYAKEWLRDVHEADDSPNTYEYYEYPIRCHITPAIGSIALNALRREHVSKMLNDRREKYSRRTVEVIHKTIKLILDHAIEGRLLEYNVATLVKTNDQKKIREEQINAACPLNAEQTARLIATIEKHPWRCFIMMALLCGIRRGELLALRWEDVDFEGRWVSLRNAIVRVRLKRLKEQPASRFSGMGSRLAPLKTPQSRRTLELPPTLITILKKHRTQQDAQRKAAGAKWSEGDFVFTSEFGAHWHPCTATSIYADVRLQADLPIETSLHDLRHSLASAMLKRGMSAKHVQAQLGHSKIQMTLDAYSHLMPGERTGISDVMSDFIAEGKRALEAKRAASAPSRVH